jgi:hypothetical protein
MTISPSLGMAIQSVVFSGNMRLPQIARCLLIEDASEELNVMTGEETHRRISSRFRRIIARFYADSSSLQNG